MAAQIQITQANLLTLSPQELSAAFKSIPQDQLQTLMKEAGLRTCLLLYGQIAYADKTGELNKFTDQITDIYNKSDQLNALLSKARKAATDGEKINLSSSEKKLITEAMTPTSGKKPDITWSDDGNNVAQIIGNATTSLNNKAKDLMTQADQSRTEMNTTMQIMSDIIKAFDNNLQSAFRNIS